jgi:hypothetical protein
MPAAHSSKQQPFVVDKEVVELITAAGSSDTSLSLAQFKRPSTLSLHS